MTMANKENGRKKKKEDISSTHHKKSITRRGGHGSVNYINRTKSNRSVEMVWNNRTEPFKVWN